MMYDEEQLIKDLETTFKAKLNAEITLINTEKGAISTDYLFLESIPDDKYIFETLGDNLLNYRGFFLMYGLVDTPIRAPSENNYIEDVIITVQIGTFDKGEKERKNLMYKLLRYRRALKAVIMNNPNLFRGYAKPLMASLKPSAFPYDSKNIVLSIGIDVKASVTAN